MDDDSQQFSLRWHNHQSSIISALGRMLESGALSDVTLSANGVSLKAHRLVLAACSQYFEHIFKDVEDNTVVVIVDCDASDLRQLLTFMYTGEVTSARSNLPSLLRLAHSLQVSGLTDANYDSTALPRENEPLKEVLNDVPMNLEDVSIKEDTEKLSDKELSEITRNDKLSKLDQIVQNLYTSHNIGNMLTTPMLSQPVHQNFTEPSVSQIEYEKKWRGGAICTICNKRLSNQYNLRVHMETHAGRRHACRACSHVSRSRDALRKHVAYRHAHSHKNSL